MVRNTVHALLAEPRAPQAPRRVWRDWALVAVLVPTAVLEGIFRPDVAWRPVAVVVAVAGVFMLLWRRTSPLVVVAVVLGAHTAVNIATIVSNNESVGLYATGAILLLPYSLFRWAAGREAAIGLAIMVLMLVLSLAADFSGVGDSVAGAVIFLFPAAIGASVRYQTTARLREMDQVKLREREQLARELHDTVAHHVSAIAIQAQAGRTLAATHRDAAVDALAVIEEEASRTLTEMRAMVGTLRQGEEPDLAPRQGVADIQRLANGAEDRPHVQVELSGELDDLRPSVQAAIYRLAQESITNALRHARQPTCITVNVAGDDDCVRMIVSDDGHANSPAISSSGYGLVGMTERAALLGGTFEAGPRPEGGWTVEAVLPRNRRAR